MYSLWMELPNWEISMCQSWPKMVFALLKLVLPTIRVHKSGWRRDMETNAIFGPLDVSSMSFVRLKYLLKLVTCHLSIAKSQKANTARYLPPTPQKWKDLLACVWRYSRKWGRPLANYLTTVCSRASNTNGKMWKEGKSAWWRLFVVLKFSSS